jgi:hypothetical protein
MRSYYIFTGRCTAECPSCLEPFENGYEQQWSENYCECSHCHASYNKFLNFEVCDKNVLANLKNSILYSKKFIDLNGSSLRINLPVKICNNEIENSYIAEINNFSGINIVTWPWKTVNFLPVMISEYLINNPEKKIMLITENSEYFIETLKNMFYLEDRNKLKFPDLPCIMKSFNPKNMFNLVTYIKATISFHGKSKHTSNREIYNKLKSSEKTLNNEFENLEWINKFTARTSDNKISITLKKEERRNFPVNKNFNIKQWINDIILYADSVKFPFETVIKWKYQKITENFICADLNSGTGNLINYTERYKPDTVIISDLDSFYRNFNNYEYIYHYLARLNTGTILAFSTEEAIRNNYMDSSGMQYAINHSIKFHTWDCDAVMDIYNKFKYSRSGQGTSFPSPLSSGEYKFKPVKYPDFTCCEPEYIKKLEEIKSGGDFSTIPEVVYFLDYLEKSMLPLKLGKCYYKNNTWLDINYISSLLVKYGKDELYKRLNERLSDIYDNECYSPAMDLIKNIIAGHNNCDVYIISHHNDSKAMSELLNDKFKNINVHSGNWDNIPLSYENLIVISTIIPDYIDASRIKYIYFFGTDDRNNMVRSIMKNHLSGITARPLSVKNADSLPSMLEKIILSLKENNADNSITDEYIIQIVKDQVKDNDSYDGVKYDLNLHKDDTVFILKGNDNKMVAVKPGSEIMIKNGDEISISRLNQVNKNFSSLVGKTIIVRKNGIFMPFREIFLNIMKYYGDNIIFERNAWKWNGFGNLYKDAVQWKIDLNDAIKRLSSDENIPVKTAKNIIANDLAKLGISAKNPDYIKLWIDDIDEYNYTPVNIERPNDYNAFKSIYKYLENRGIHRDEDILRKYYDAILRMQKYRTDLIKSKRSINDTTARMIHDVMIRLINSLPHFQIADIRKARVMNDLPSNIDVDELLKNVELLK